MLHDMASACAAYTLVLLFDIVPLPLNRKHPPEADVDAVAGALGVRWADHVLSKIDALVKEGKSGDAARMYRDEAGVSWDEAHAAVRDWEYNALERKLRLLAQQIRTGVVAPKT
jgi:hypothetical protein